MSLLKNIHTSKSASQVESSAKVLPNLGSVKTPQGRDFETVMKIQHQEKKAAAKEDRDSQANDKNSGDKTKVKSREAKGSSEQKPKADRTDRADDTPKAQKKTENPSKDTSSTKVADKQAVKQDTKSEAQEDETVSIAQEVVSEVEQETIIADDALIHFSVLEEAFLNDISTATGGLKVEDELDETLEADAEQSESEDVKSGDESDLSQILALGVDQCINQKTFITDEKNQDKEKSQSQPDVDAVSAKTVSDKKASSQIDTTRPLVPTLHSESVTNANAKAVQTLSEKDVVASSDSAKSSREGAILLRDLPASSLEKPADIKKAALPAFAEKLKATHFSDEQVRSMREQIQGALKATMNESKNEMNMKLEPPEWGRVNIKIEIQKNSETNVTIISENPAVKLALDKSLAELKQSLSQDGLKLGYLHIGMGNQSQAQQDEARSRFGDRSEREVLEAAPEIAKTARAKHELSQVVDSII